MTHFKNSELILPGDGEFRVPGVCSLMPGRALMGAAGGGGGGASLVYVGYTVGSTGTTHTYTSHAIGGAAADRQVVVIAHGFNSGGAGVISSLTVGGTSATVHAETNDQDWNRIAICSAAHATGSTADIAVTWTASQTAAVAITVFAMYGAGSTPTATTIANSASGGLTLDTNVVSGGFIVGGTSSDTGAVTWTGLTEEHDSTLTNRSASAAGHTATSTESPRSISTSSLVTVAGACVAWPLA